MISPGSWNTWNVSQCFDENLAQILCVHLSVCVHHLYTVCSKSVLLLTVGLLKDRNAEVGQLTGEKAALEREMEKLKEQVSIII